MRSFDAITVKRVRYAAKRRAHVMLASCALALLASLVGDLRAQVVPAAGSAPTNSQTIGHGLRDALRALHHSDQRSRAAAEAHLRAVGLTPQQIEQGRLIYHPQDEARMQAASQLARAAFPWQWMCLAELTRDANAKVRMSALEAAQTAMPNPLLNERLREMSEQDPDALVRGLARLISAEWTDKLPRNPIRDSSVVPASAQSPVQTSPALIPPQPPGPRGPMPPATPSPLPGRGPELVPPPSGLRSPEEVPPPPGRGPTEPGILRRPLEGPLPEGVPAPDGFTTGPLLQTEVDAPLGFTGRSSVMPTEIQQDSHFVPVEDRWRIGFPEWDRYGRGFPLGDDYPYAEGAKTDPYNQNVLKGDYPVFGQHTFFNLTATSLTLNEHREVPTPTTPFESTVDPFQEEFFGRPEQYFFNQNLILSLELFHGDAAFKPVDWRLRVVPVFNINYLDVEELGIVNPDVRRGTTRGRNYMAAEQWFAEAKLADFGPDYDFFSVRAGSQLFVSDFRGFVFSDVNRAVRLFGTRWSNRHQFNVVYFDQREKDTNSELNTWTDDRHQNVFIANYFIQDFVFPGYTFMVNFHYNRDRPSMKFDRNDFLVRPDAAGVFQQHNIEAYYLGVHGDGHIGRYNISNAFYWVLGSDSLNPIAGTPQDINAQMAAIELSYDRDYVRFRTSFFWASGDKNVFDGQAEGFDTIFDAPNFAGGEFSYWQRQAVRLFGVNLVNRKSLVPDLRSSKIEGQSNFVNPGLFLHNLGFDVDITPKLKMIHNTNFLWFEQTDVLERFTFQDNIPRELGTDMSFGFEYRPLLNNNIIFVAGTAFLFPAAGFKDLYETIGGKSDVMHSHFLEVDLTY